MRASRSEATATMAPRSCAASTSSGDVAHPSGRRGVGHQEAEQLAVGQPGVEVGDDELDPERLGPRRQHRERLRVGVGVDDETRRRDLRRSGAPASSPPPRRSARRAGSPRRPGSAVRSDTMVWKASSASSRPWLISGW